MVLLINKRKMGNKTTIIMKGLTIALLSGICFYLNLKNQRRHVVKCKIPIKEYFKFCPICKQLSERNIKGPCPYKQACTLQN